MQRHLLGEELAIWGTMEQIKEDDLLFLYNTATYEVTGPLKPIGKCQKNLVPGAWNNKFPVQIKFDETEDTQTFPYTNIQHIIKKYRNGIYPWPELDEEQTQQLLEIIT